MDLLIRRDTTMDKQMAQKAHKPVELPDAVQVAIKLSQSAKAHLEKQATVVSSAGDDQLEVLVS